MAGAATALQTTFGIPYLAGALMPIILVGQKAMGYAYFFLIIIPHLIFGPKKCKQLEMQEK